MKNRITLLLGALCLLAHALTLATEGQVGGHRPPLQSQGGAGNAFGPGDHVLVLKVGGLERQYIVHVPRGYDGKTPVPVVIMFHGAGGTARSAMRQTGWTEKSDEAGFLAVFPEGTSRDPTKAARFKGNPQVWNDGSGRGNAAQRAVDDVGFVNAVIDDLQARFAIEKRRVYVTGFSNGASMAFRLGLELSTRIAAIAPVSGPLWLENPKLKQPVSLIYLMGAEDAFNPLDSREPSNTAQRKQASALQSKRALPGESALKWAKMLDCPLEPKVVYDKEGVKAVSYTPCQENAEVIYYTIGGMGHTWPGGKSRLPEWMVGKTTDKLKGNDIIWEFFQKHPKP